MVHWFLATGLHPFLSLGFPVKSGKHWQCPSCAIVTHTAFGGHVNSVQTGTHLSTPRASGMQADICEQSWFLVQSGRDGFSHTDLIGFHTKPSTQLQTGLPFGLREQTSLKPQATVWHGLTHDLRPSTETAQIKPLEQSLFVVHSPLGATLSGRQPFNKSLGCPT